MSSAAKNLQCENLTVTDGAQAGLVLTCVSAQGKVAWAAGGGGGGGGGQQGFRAKDGNAVITDNAAASVGGDVTGNLMGVDSCVGGPNSVSLGTGSVAVGANSETRNEGSVAVGRDAKSSHVGIYGNVAVGDSASIPNGAGNGVTVGRLATLTSTGFGGVSVGAESAAHASGGVSVGLQAATDVNGVAIGSGASTLGMTGAVSIGVGVIALEADSFNAQHRALTAPVSPSVSGNVAVFNGNELLATPLTMDTDGDISNVVTINGLPYPPPSSTANGYEITNLVQGDIHTDSAGVAAATGIESIAIGCTTSNMAIASGTGSIAIGNGTQAVSDNSICLGSGIASSNPGTFNVLHRDGPFSPTVGGLRVAAFNSNELLGTPVAMDTDGNVSNVATLATNSITTNSLTTNSITANSINLLQYVSDPLDASNPQNRPPYVASEFTITSFGGSWLSPPGSPPGLITGLTCYATITYFPGIGNPRLSVINIGFPAGVSGYIGTIPATSSAFLRVDLNGYLGSGGGVGYNSAFLSTTLTTSLPTTTVFSITADEFDTIRFDFSNTAGTDVDVYLSGSIPGLATITCSIGTA